jgi:Flp pilus assembly protein TadB
MRAMRAIYIRSLKVMRFRQSSWPDSRLDEFRDQVSDNLRELGRRVDHQSNRIDNLQHTILVVGGGLFAAFVAVLAAMIGLIATQL